MSIISSSELISFIGASSYDANVQALHLGIEQMIKNDCGKPFESTTYFEQYDGKGGYYRLPLNKIPVTSVARVSTDLQAVIKIKNTTKATTASVKVDATNVTLTIDTTTSTLAIATYTTLSSLVAQINTLSASGWVAEIYDSDFNAKLTNKLLSQDLDVTYFDTVREYEYLYMGTPCNFTFISDTNSIETYFPSGSQNIGVNYTAGTSPADIKYLVLSICKSAYDRKSNDADGIKRFTVGDITTEYMSMYENDMFMNIIRKNSKVTL